MGELVPRGDAAPGPLGPRKTLLQDFYDSLSPKTLRAYRACLERVAKWAKVADAEALARELLQNDVPTRRAGRANQLMLTLRTQLLEKGFDGEACAPAYVNLHLNALRGLVKAGRLAGDIVWTVDVADAKTEAFRDTAGPGWDGVVAILAAARDDAKPLRRTRNVAIVMVLATMGLRRDELVSLDLAHYDGKRLLVKRKRKRDRKPVTVPADTRDAIDAWLEHRGREPGPLFTSGENARRRRADGRLAESSLHWLVHKISVKAGHPTRPHGLRHAAVTQVLEETKGDVRAAQRFADHANPATTMKYDDNRTDVAGREADRLARKLVEDARKKNG